MAYPMEPLRTCVKCAVHHYENCPDCFGFGVYDSVNGHGQVPVSAFEAMGNDPMPPNARACPTCHSTAAGVHALREAGR